MRTRNEKLVEKRKFQRLESPLDVTIEILTDEEVPGGLKPLNGATRNISLQGICLEVQQVEISGIPLLLGPPGNRAYLLDMEIELGTGEHPLKAKGEVRWYDVARDSVEFMYNVGVLFTEFKGDGEEALKAFLKKQGKGFLERFFGGK